MTAIGLQIAKPATGSVLAKAPTVELQGAPVTLPREAAGTALYYRWYSDLHPGTVPDKYALDPPGALLDPTVLRTRALRVGTHAITFAVTDQATEKSAALKAVKHGGVTGGRAPATPAPVPGHPCVVHVLWAALHPPLKLSRTSAVVDMEGPVLWEDAEYQKRNRVRYRFRFTPTVAPSTTVDILPAAASIKVVPNEKDKPPLDPPLVRYTGPLALPADGNYTLVLRVEDLQRPTLFHESDPLAVVVTP